MATTASHAEASAQVREPVPSKRLPKAVKATEEQVGAAVPAKKKRKEVEEQGQQRGVQEGAAVPAEKKRSRDAREAGSSGECRVARVARGQGCWLRW